MKKYRYLFFLVLVIILIPNITIAANQYVRADATGDNGGSDWTNAFTELPAALVRGDTYYIADGNYGSYTFDDAESGTQYITIKKAIGLDYGTDIGWQSSYGDGQAVFAMPLVFSSDYWIFDGQMRNKNDWQDEDSYGFKIDKPVDCNSITNQTYHINLGNAEPRNYVTIKYVTMGHCGDNYRTVAQTSLASTYAGNNITISHSYFHDASVFMIIRRWRNSVVEYSYFYNNWFEQGISNGSSIATDYEDGNIYRFNVFHDSGRGSGVITPGHGPGTGHVNKNSKIYGNIFRGNLGGGPLKTGASFFAYNYSIYNNLIIDVLGPVGSAEYSAFSFGGYDDAGDGSVLYNNIWYNTNLDFVGADRGGVYMRGPSAQIVSDYNLSDDLMTGLDNFQHWTGGDSLFVNYAGGNYRLSQPTLSGIVLPVPFNRDLLGNERGADGGWDIGAYEYEDVPPAKITTLRID